MEPVTIGGRIEGAGTQESVWRTWLPDQAFASMPWSGDGLPPRWVVIAPHPNDEILTCGGTLSMHAARGGAVHLIAVTDGEASHDDTTGGWTREQLATMRREERLRGLRVLGLESARLTTLALPDGHIAAHEAELIESLRPLLRPGDRVISTWRADGHPDHEACGRAAAMACEATGAQLAEAPVWMWHWAAPGDARVPWDRLHQVPLTEAVRRGKAAALSQHQSQLTPRSPSLGPVLGDAIQTRVWRDTEYFFVP